MDMAKRRFEAWQEESLANNKGLPKVEGAGCRGGQAQADMAGGSRGDACSAPG